MQAIEIKQNNNLWKNSPNACFICAKERKPLAEHYYQQSYPQKQAFALISRRIFGVHNF